MLRYTTEIFIEKAKKVHGNKYDYSLTEYKGIFEKVKIICPIHGEFIQTAHNHLNGNGCPICGAKNPGNKKRLKAKNDFIEKVKKIHGDKYDCSLVNYVNAETYVKFKL